VGAAAGGGGDYDFFVSYTGADAAWAEWIPWQLETGVRLGGRPRRSCRHGTSSRARTGRTVCTARCRPQPEWCPSCPPDRAPAVRQISANWRGRPLESHEVIINTIAATTTRSGLKARAELDTGSYPTGIKISDKEMKQLEATSITRHEFHGNWNYTIHPTATRPHAPN
jgi:hypothetical protein